MKRRELMLSLAAVGASQHIGLQRAIAQVTGADMKSQIEAAIDVDKNFKFAPAAVLSAVIDIYKNISKTNFESDVINRLDYIKDSLTKINEKLDNIIVLLKDLPRVVRHEVDASNQTALLGRINSYNDRLFAYISAHPSPEKMPTQERNILRTVTVEGLITDMQTMTVWGPVGYVPVASGFLTLAIACKWAGFDRKQYAALRTVTSNWMINCSEYFSNLSVADRQLYDDNKKIANEHHASVLLHDITTFLPRTTRVALYANMNGSFDEGFSWDGPTGFNRHVLSNPNDADLKLYYRSKFIDIKNPSSGNDGSMIALLSILNKLITDGKVAGSRAPIYLRHGELAAEFSKNIAQLDY